MQVIEDVRLWAEHSLNTCRFYRLSTPTLTSRSGRWRCSVQLLDQFKTAGDNPHEQPVQRGERAAGEHGEQVPQRPRPGSLEGGQAGDQVRKQRKVLLGVKSKSLEPWTIQGPASEFSDASHERCLLFPPGWPTFEQSRQVGNYKCSVGWNLDISRSARSGHSTSAPGLQPVPTRLPENNNLHFPTNGAPAPLQQGILKPGLQSHNQGGSFNHHRNPQGPPHQNVPGSLNLGLSAPGPHSNHNQALGPFPGLHNQERRGGNRVSWFEAYSNFWNSCHYRWTFSRFFMECIKVDEAEATAWKPSWKCAICDEIPSRVGQIQFVCARYHMLKLHPSRNELPGLSFQIYRIFTKSTSGCLKILGQRFWIKRDNIGPTLNIASQGQQALVTIYYVYFIDILCFLHPEQ